ncbi:glycosyltransferase family 4 protein [Macrococcoides caseolyticum]|uniref:glycosyltransferase family 4 protein n=1 Tax=Macrococcoides caseolyticum TaxID=69966 RepID=UPI000C3303B6|nr:glycosyltransferase family 4 protein [Macrococcus caseolyticus]PKE50822.1 glycosyltransferase family 1 protein [Macrococcus caseolyticus]
MKIIQLSAIDMTMNNFLRPLNIATRDAGFEVHCVCSSGPFTKEIIQDNFYYYDVKIDRKISVLSNLKTIRQLTALFRNVKPDIVHVHTPVASVLGRIAAKIAGVPTIIYTAHGFYFHEGMSDKQYKIFFNIEKYIGRYFTDYIFTQSQEDYEIARKNKFLTKDKSNNYVCISNGIDLKNKFNYQKYDRHIKKGIHDKHKIPYENLVITFIGRLVKEKGILDLLKAFNTLNNNEITLVIIGGLPQGERDTATYEEIQKFKTHPNIIFTGHVSNTEEYLYSSDIFCLPSYREGMPRSIIEAMSMHNAVLATNIRGCREEVVQDETGLLFDVNNYEQIANSIDYLFQNRDVLSQMKQKGYERAKELYDEEKVVATQIDIFKKVTRG